VIKISNNITKWVIFDKYGKKIKTHTIKHKNNLHYLELEPFEEDLIKRGLYAHNAESLNQQFLKGKTFIEKLKSLGWEFNKDGFIVS
jgi:predicted transcriptional regulator